MNKTKSAILLGFISLILAVLCVWCTCAFTAPDGIKTYHSLINIIEKDASLKGGYSAVYYPEGVISAKEYTDNVAAFGEDELSREKYEEKYVVCADNANLYLEKEVVGKEDGTVSDEYKADFNSTVNAIVKRYEAKQVAGARVEVCDGYTIRVTLPKMTDDLSTVLSVYAYDGDFSIAYGDKDKKIIQNSKKMNVSDYVKAAHAENMRDTAYVVIDFTPAGRKLIADATASSSSTMYFMIGDNSVISLSVSQKIDLDSLSISGSYTDATAKTVATIINTTLQGNVAKTGLTVGDAREFDGTFGENTMLFIYITMGVLMLGMMVFFCVRYHALGVAHIYTYLAYLVSTILCLAFIEFVNLNLGVIMAIVFTSLLLFLSNVTVFENVRKEYESGKTMVSSVKSGYKASFWGIFDLHIALALIAFVTFFIATTELRVIAFMFGLGVAFSGVCSLLVTRFMWYLLMKLGKKQDAFCNFQRKEEDDD